ncbi:CLUMA_CG009652, isoform A [Clunio marinus]|uniref:RING-type E3 ubiquitin transferase n=1 Tax=Clunio marinus TaxID=568069 RepID=A0A1J1ICQ9_9DIPT|nr:CLUMA_CG009652, isoform A [Clunio marinus]
MRSILIFLTSAVLSAGVIANAVIQKKQFYPSVVYISKSNPSMAVIYFQSLILVLMLGKLMRKIFLGTLRAAEFEHLMERFWYALTETCLAFTVFRDDFNPKFIALFTVLLFLKSFHWLAEDRVDYMERSPVIGWVFHIRVAGLLSVLGFLDYLLIMYAYQSTIAKGPTVQLVFGFEYAILITMVANTTIKYVLHASELRSDTPWENKAVFLLYTELVIGLIRVILYIVFVFLMVKIYTLPLFAFRPMYYTIRNFKKALNDVILSRRAIHNMNTLYPDATAEELALSDNICIICREDMVSSSKKLPCGHIFHTLCLRSWFQRQQTCPTCRLNILRTPITATQPQAQPAANNNANQNVRPNEAPPVPQQNPFLNLLNDNRLGNQVPNPSSSSSVSSATTTTTSTHPGAPFGAPIPPPPFFFPSMPFMAPYTIPPPPMPQNLEQLTEEELRAIEGNERRHVEERIKLLRNVQTMLNASAALMNQYQMVVANLPPPPISLPLQQQQPQQSSSSSSVAAETAEQQSTKVENVSLTKENDNKNEVKLEDVGSEDETINKPSTSRSSEPTSSKTATTLDSPSTTSTFIANESSTINGETNEANEIRKRRLQKFLQSD